jgi:AcrR family transcriptional regulator
VNSLTAGAPAVTVPPVHSLMDPAYDPPVDDGQRRGRILRALATSMAEKGYQATTIADIARLARVSKTVVYTHFRDKEHCLLELYSRATDRVLETVREAQAAAHAEGLPWRARLGAGVGAYLEAMAAGPAVAWASLVEVQGAGLITFVAADLAQRHPDEVRPVPRDLVLAAVGGINELMLARVERGEADRLPEDADVATAVVVGLLERRG